MDWQSFTDKVVSCTTDGASVMMGKISGVTVKIRMDQPCMITVHCKSHRLELAYGDACKGIQLYDKTVRTLATGLFYFYAKSPLHRTNLKRAAAALDNSTVQHINIRSSRSNEDTEPESAKELEAGPDSAPKRAVLMPTRPGGSRWVQHTTRALNNIRRSYKCLVLHMTQVILILFNRTCSLYPQDTIISD